MKITARNKRSQSRAKQIARSDRRQRAASQAVTPRQFGNLHERMRYLVALAHQIGPGQIDHSLWNAIFDLETEVSFYAPQSPPFGRRAVA